MGAGSSVEVPGGGTEGYHVLRVSNSSLSNMLQNLHENRKKLQKQNLFCQ